jgi:hypothetical protein
MIRLLIFFRFFWSRCPQREAYNGRMVIRLTGKPYNVVRRGYGLYLFAEVTLHNE